MTKKILRGKKKYIELVKFKTSKKEFTFEEINIFVDNNI